MQDKINKQIIEFKNTIDENSIRTLKSSILKIVNEQKNANVFISLKSFTDIHNSKTLTLMIKELEKVSLRIGITIDFIDYAEELFVILKKHTANTGINLYKNKEVAILFVMVGAFKEDTKVLVFDENEQNSKKLYFDLCTHGYVIERAQNMKEFLSGINSESYDIIVSRTFLNKRVIKTTITKNTLSLSKKLIMNLPIFMNKAAETLVSFTGLEASKVSHSIKSFDTVSNPKSISAVMPFKGDIEGYFTLVFPRAIAIIALESLLGEKVEENDTATLTDGVGEFCNIITGAAKTEFDSKDIKVVFDLPKTYASLNETKKHIGTNNGVWMDMQLSGQPFYMFITK
jgi:CheY-specific phosphatase CheX